MEGQAPDPLARQHLSSEEQLDLECMHHALQHGLQARTP
jgi:hypothetical protein